MLTSTPAARIRRSMATAALTHILALNTRLFFKSKFVYNGRWPEAATRGGAAMCWITRRILSVLAGLAVLLCDVLSGGVVWGQ